MCAIIVLNFVLTMRNPLFLIISLIFSLTFSWQVAAKTTPKIGLVLSGGGAKGSAHVGVLKVLEKHNIKVDYIAGTSIGSYVGAMYALGYSAKEIEDKMMSTNWDAGYSDTIPREALHYEEKRQKDTYNIPVPLGYENKRIKTPSGIIIGQTMSKLLRSSTGLVSEFESFDELAIPYRAVAANLVTSEPVVLSSGSLVNVIKASASIPGALQPTNIDGMLLVDGGLANNLPIDVVKAMGADIVIAVDIGSALLKKEDIKSTVDVLNQLSTILTTKTTEKQKLLLTEKDILIRPEVDYMSTTSWDVLPQALVLGEKAANELSHRLAELSSSSESFENYQLAKQKKSKQWLSSVKEQTVRIVFQNDSKMSEDILRNTLALEEGQVIDEKSLSDAIDRVYALNKFEHVDSEFHDTDEGRVLTIITRAKSWGPNYFKFGFSLQESFSLRTAVQLDLAYIMTDVTDNGGQWKNELSVGFEKRLATEFYQPLDDNQDFFARAIAQWEKHIWTGSNQKELTPDLEKQSYLGSGSLGYNLNPNAIVEAGLLAETGNVAFVETNAEQPRFDSFGGYVKFSFDNLDSINFPTDGNQLLIDVYFRNDHYNHEFFGVKFDQSTQIIANWRGAISLQEHTLVGIAKFATVDSDADYTVHISDLGGFLNLSAYQKNELVGTHKAFGALVYHYNLGQNVFGLKDYPIYLGTSLEAGNIWLSKQNIDINDLIYSGSLFFGIDTTLGPAAVGVGYADTNEQSFFFSIGKTW